MTASSGSGLSFAANDIYDIAGTGSSSGSAGIGGQATAAVLTPVGSVSDAAGDLYISTASNCVDEIPATSGTQWGQSMTAGDIYRVAGTCGTAGSSGDGGAATSALLDDPQELAMDANGDIYIADTTNNRVQELAATTHSQWGQSMTAGDIYTIAGSSTGASGKTGDSGASQFRTLERTRRIGLRRQR